MNTIILTLVSIVLLVGAGCFGCGSSPPNPDDYDSVLRKARSASRQVDSYRYHIAGMTNSTITDDLGITRVHTIEWEDEGVYVSPDRLSHTHTLRVYEEGWPEWSARTRESVCIGSKWYEREAGETRWEVKDVSPGLKGWYLATDSSLVLDIDSLMDVERLPNETIRGIDCLHYEGKVDMPAFIDKLPDYLYPDERYREWLGYTDRTVELWIGEDDYVIRKYQTDERNPYPSMSDLSSPPGSESRHVATEVTEFYDYNEPVDIEPPA
ncbi:MAG: hypothetical protein ISS53_00870 [Dehalococcoidia bacterium]|nr:hypothetical protein [Dehalococcoidia bacterium]